LDIRDVQSFSEVLLVK